jgi:hypothetical protein
VLLKTVLTKDTLETIPIWGIKGAGVLAHHLNEGSREPVMVKHLSLGADEGQVEADRRCRLHF